MPKSQGRFVKPIRIAILMAMILYLLSSCSSAAIGYDYTIREYDVSCVIQQDGSAIMTETITFDILNDTSLLSFNIDYKKAGSIDLMLVGIASGNEFENDGRFIEVSSNGNQVQNSIAGYEAKDNGKSLNIQLKVLSQTGTRRMVKLQYALDTMIMRYEDNAMLQHVFFTTIQAERIDQARLSVVVPPTTMDLGSWVKAVSLPAFESASGGRDEIAFESQAISRSGGLTLFALFAPTAFPQAAKGSGSLTWDEVTENAAALERQAVWREQSQQTVRALVFILLAASLLLGLLIYWLFDREAVSSFRHRYWTELPDYRKPAVISILLHKNRPGRLILSTLLDLVNRGELDMQGNVFGLPLEPDLDSKMVAYERFLIHWLFEKIAKNSMVSMAEIRKFARDHDTAGEMQAFYSHFRALIDLEMDEKKLLDQSRIRSGRAFAYAAGVVYLAATTAASIFLRDPIGLLLLIPAAGMGVYGFKIRRLSAAGRDIQARIQAVSRTIRDGKLIAQTDHLSICRDLIPLAEAMGLSEAMIDSLMAAGKSISDPYEAVDLSAYGIRPTSRTWQAQLIALRADLKVMDSMLSASLLLSSGLHH